MLSADQSAALVHCLAHISVEVITRMTAQGRQMPERWVDNHDRGLAALEHLFELASEAGLGEEIEPEQIPSWYGGSDLIVIGLDGWWVELITQEAALAGEEHLSVGAAILPITAEWIASATRWSTAAFTFLRRGGRTSSIQQLSSLKSGSQTLFNQSPLPQLSLTTV